MRVETVEKAVGALRQITVQCKHCKAWASTGEFGGQGRVEQRDDKVVLKCQCGYTVAEARIG